MVMSWQFGDFFGIYDYGYIEWGVVQVFGLVEYVIFWIEEGCILILVCFIFEFGDVVGVSYILVY